MPQGGLRKESAEKGPRQNGLPRRRVCGICGRCSLPSSCSLGPPGGGDRDSGSPCTPGSPPSQPADGSRARAPALPRPLSRRRARALAEGGCKEGRPPARRRCSPAQRPSPGAPRAGERAPGAGGRPGTRAEAGSREVRRGAGGGGGGDAGGAGAGGGEGGGGPELPPPHLSPAGARGNPSPAARAALPALSARLPPSPRAVGAARRGAGRELAAAGAAPPGAGSRRARPLGIPGSAFRRRELRGGDM